MDWVCAENWLLDPGLDSINLYSFTWYVLLMQYNYKQMIWVFHFFIGFHDKIMSLDNVLIVSKTSLVLFYNYFVYYI